MDRDIVINVDVDTEEVLQKVKARLKTENEELRTENDKLKAVIENAREVQALTGKVVRQLGKLQDFAAKINQAVERADSLLAAIDSKRLDNGEE